MPLGISGFARVSRILLLQASRWDIWRRSIGLVVGRAGLSRFSGHPYSISPLSPLSVFTFPWNSPVTSYPAYQAEVFKRYAAEGDGHTFGVAVWQMTRHVPLYSPRS
jgi:hypothetical protein